MPGAAMPGMLAGVCTLPVPAGLSVSGGATLLKPNGVITASGTAEGTDSWAGVCVSFFPGVSVTVCGLGCGRDTGGKPGIGCPGCIPGGTVRGTSLRSCMVGRFGSASGGITPWMPGAIPGACPAAGPGAGGAPWGGVGAVPPFVTTVGGGSSRDGARVIGLMIVRTGFSFPSGITST